MRGLQVVEFGCSHSRVEVEAQQLAIMFNGVERFFVNSEGLDHFGARVFGSLNIAQECFHGRFALNRLRIDLDFEGDQLSFFQFEFVRIIEIQV